MATITYRVDGMTCDHCVQAVTKEVSGVDGVDAVKVDLDSKLVTVTGPDLRGDDLVAAIDEAGYDAEPA